MDVGWQDKNQEAVMRIVKQYFPQNESRKASAAS